MSCLRISLLVSICSVACSSPVDVKALLNSHEPNKDMTLEDKYSQQASGLSWGCDLCKLVVSFIQEAEGLNKTQHEIASFLTDQCVILKVESPAVCRGIVPLYRDEVLLVLDHLFLDPDEVCGYVLNPRGYNCTAKVYNPWSQWFIDIPDPPSNPPPPAKTEAGTIRVLHLSDVHIDPRYVPGSLVNCGEPLCCRNSSLKGTAGFWGEPSNCDLPLWTYENMLQHINKTLKFDYILWTGDLPGHYVWEQSKSNVTELMDYLTQQFLKYFPGIPVYGTLGNHEGVPVNSFPPDAPDVFKVVPEVDRSDWLYQTILRDWKYWIPVSEVSTSVLSGGYYAVKIRPGLKLVSLNTNFCNNQNWWLLLNMKDPTSQLQWLLKELTASEQIGEKVHVIAHIPPGNGDCLHFWSLNYYKIFNRFKHTIMAQFYGHIHADCIEVFFDPDTNYTQATGIAYLGPSASPQGGNPAYRTYTIDTKTYQVLNHQTYLLNLTEANKRNITTWSLEYSAREDYNMTSLSPGEWNKVIHRMWTDDQLFNKFYANMFRQRQGACNKTCRQETLCAQLSGFNGANKHVCSWLKN